MFYVYAVATGALVSVASTIELPLPDGLAAKERAAADWGTQVWDASTADLIARPAQTTNVISRQDFLDRLGSEVEVAVQMVTQGTDANAAMLRAFILRLTVVGEVHVDDPRTIGAVQALVAFGLIDNAKMAAVLAPKVLA